MAKKKSPGEMKQDLSFEPAALKKACACCGRGAPIGRWGVKFTSKYDEKPATICLECFMSRNAGYMSDDMRRFLDTSFPNLTKKWRESKDDRERVQEEEALA